MLKNQWQKWLFGALVGCLCMGAAAAANVRHADGRAQYAREMNGDALPDGFGSRLPAGVDAAYLTRLVVPDAPRQNWRLVGMKPWPSQKGLFVATLCSSAAKQKPQQPDGNCTYDIDPKNTLAVAVVRYDGKNPPQLWAKPYVENAATPLSKSAFALQNDIGDTVRGDLLCLDFAPYRLNAETLAFGVRVGTQTGYAGGMAVNQSVTLFADIRGSLKPVLSVPVYALHDLAGEWRPDGTREREISETQFFIKVLPQQHNGFADLLVYRQGRQQGGTVYRWQPEKTAYQPAR